MVNVLNPTNFLYLDIIYYFLVVGLGPVLLWSLVIYMPKRSRLYDQYVHTGVVCNGIITHRKVVVTRGSLTGVESSRRYSMRFAYRAPGTNTVYIKDFVSVPRLLAARLRQRCIRVTVVPGLPASGVPSFLLSDPSYHGPGLVLVTLISLAMTGFCLYLFAALCAVFVLDSCRSVGVETMCYLSLPAFLLSAVIIVPLGLLGAWIFHRAHEREIPGVVWKRVELGMGSSNTPLSRPGGNYSNNLDNEIPLAEVATVLEQTEGEHQEEAGGSDLVMVESNTVATPVFSSTNDLGTQDRGTKKQQLPEASVVEIV